MNILPSPPVAAGPRGPLARREKSGPLKTEGGREGFKKVISGSFRDTED